MEFPWRILWIIFTSLIGFWNFRPTQQYRQGSFHPFRANGPSFQRVLTQRHGRRLKGTGKNGEKQVGALSGVLYSHQYSHFNQSRCVAKCRMFKLSELKVWFCSYQILANHIVRGVVRGSDLDNDMVGPTIVKSRIRANVYTTEDDNWKEVKVRWQYISVPNRQKNPFQLLLVKLRNRALKFLVHFTLVCFGK